jgi:cold shock CspA family protein
VSQQSFRELGVSAPVVDALAARSIQQPFPIQELVLPDALASLDVLAQSPTGSGKTPAARSRRAIRAGRPQVRPLEGRLHEPQQAAVEVVGGLERSIGSRPGRTRGEMLWFNNVKDHGYIATEAGQRLYVHGSGFRDGSRPQGRCAGRPVSLHVLGDGQTARAEDVVLVEEPSPRRARMRRSGGR